ncbi:MAG TPA: aminopeptidase N [Chiayiivirga sp.]|nr:aminopeptidase N [Chiayiivirga sp.]
MIQSPDPEIRLADYQPPAWRVQRVRLDFDLDSETTRVGATLTLVPDPTHTSQTLRLDGEDLELLHIALDGRILAAHEYRVDAQGLEIDGIDGPCELHTQVQIKPSANTRLEGLYESRGALFTQCEAQGFRRITYFIDRPDVSAIYEVTLRADKARYPVLLCNGDPVEHGDLSDGRHFARWHDPHPKPSYLFALVAGALECISAPFTTRHGRQVAVNLWAAAEDIDRCRYALGAVLRAMAWDEQRFGRVYDLSVFNVVAAQDFTMGAMENKGLNIFNARLLLADVDTATDDDFIAIESVIGHEYFHNWSGNRVTLRDWFQLSLKEGLTVFRDQEFTADLHSRGLKRIDDVRVLKARQFVEDAGPLSHPVRPASYREINNFYTATVYEKGAELVRMLHTLLGEATFRQGLDDYFATHDGGAATVEDLVAAMARSSGRDLMQFRRWWDQAGTPRIEVIEDFDASSGSYTLLLNQHGVDPSLPLHIPLACAFYDASGHRIETPPETDAKVHGPVLELRESMHVLQLQGLTQPPLPVFAQGLSAPVRMDVAYTPEQLARIAEVESDPLSCWQSLQDLARVAIMPGALRLRARQALVAAHARILTDDHADPAFVAECLALPDFWDLCSDLPEIDLDGVWRDREHLGDILARQLAPSLDARYHALREQASGGLDGPSAAARRLRNACLARLARIERDGQRATLHFEDARGLTDRLAALTALVHRGAPQAPELLQRFARQHQGNSLMTDRWLSIVAATPRAGAVLTVAELLAGSYWNAAQPNRVRAILAPFVRNNIPAFHRLDGAGYDALFARLPELDATNPAIAARHLALLESWQRLDATRRRLIGQHLDQLESRLSSRDCREMLARLRVNTIDPVLNQTSNRPNLA